MDSKGDEDDEVTDDGSERRASRAAESLIESINRSLKFWEMMERPVRREDSFITSTEIMASPRSRENDKTDMALSFISEQLSFADLKYLHTTREKLIKYGRITKHSLKELVKNVCSKLHHQENIRIKDLLKDIAEDQSTAVESLGVELLKAYDQTLGSGSDVSGASTWYEAARINRGRNRSNPYSTSNTTSKEVKLRLEQAERLGVNIKRFNRNTFVTERSLLASLKKQIQGKLAKEDLLANTTYASRFFNSNPGHEIHVCDSDVYKRRLSLMKRKLDKNKSKISTANLFRSSSKYFHGGTTCDSRTWSSRSHCSSTKFSGSNFSREQNHKKNLEINSCGDQEMVGRTIKTCEGSLNLSLKSKKKKDPAAGENASTISFNSHGASCNGRPEANLCDSLERNLPSNFSEENILFETEFGALYKHDESVADYYQARDDSSFFDVEPNSFSELSQAAIGVNRKVHWRDDNEVSLTSLWSDKSDHTSLDTITQVENESAWSEDENLEFQEDLVPECLQSLDTCLPLVLDESSEDESKFVVACLPRNALEQLSKLDKQKSLWDRTGLQTLMLASLLAMGAVCYTFSNGEWQVLDLKALEKLFRSRYLPGDDHILF